MSLILDALKRARQLGQGKTPSTEAQNLMRSFGTTQRSRRRRTRKLALYAIPILVLAGGMAIAGNYWLKQKLGKPIVASTDQPRQDVEPIAQVPPAPPPPAEQQAPIVAAAIAPETAAPAPAASAPAPKVPVTTITAPRAETPSPRSANTGTQIVSVPRTEKSDPPRIPAPPALPPTADPVPPPAPTATAVAASSPPAATNRAAATLPSVVARGADTAADAYALFQLYYNTNDYANALVQVKRLVLANPADAGNHLNSGAVHLALGNLSEATKEFNMVATQLKATDAQKSKAYNNLGAIYLEQKDPTSARNAFQRAIEVDPINGDAYLNRGLVHRALGQTEQAKQDLTKATQLKLELTSNIKAHFNLAEIYDKQGEVGESLEHYKTFVSLAGGLPAYNDAVKTAQSRIQELEKKLVIR